MLACTLMNVLKSESLDELDSAWPGTWTAEPWSQEQKCDRMILSVYKTKEEGLSSWHLPFSCTGVFVSAVYSINFNNVCVIMPLEIYIVTTLFQLLSYILPINTQSV